MARSLSVKTSTRNHLWLVALVVSVAKSLAIPFMDSKTWLGADGETYLAIAKDIAKTGILTQSEQMLYWSGGGYSILISPFMSLGEDAATRVFLLLQTALFGASVAYMCMQLAATRLTRFAIPLAYLLLLNPTLSLSSLQIGYEAPTAALHMLVLGLMIADLRTDPEDRLISGFVIAALLVSLSAALQPRLAVGGGALLLIWAIARVGWRRATPFVALALVLVLVLPGILMLRTKMAVGQATLGSNIGVMTRMGAGPGSTGTYNGGADTGLDCNVDGLSAVEAGNAQAKCALLWNLQNPVAAAKLAWMKSAYLWSPWFGPVSGGTQARNLYLKFHPVRSFIDTQQRLDLVMGPEGKLISWLWIIGAWIVVAIGALGLWRLDGVERYAGLGALAIILGSWAVAILTIGDHRHRVPFMGMSLFLQLVGVVVIFNRGKLSLGNRRAIDVFARAPRPERSSKAQTKSTPQVSSTESSTNTRVGAALSKSAKKKRR